MWTLWDARGFPIYRNPGGEDVIPFWSSLSRVRRVQKAVPRLASYKAREIPWDFFVEKWVPDLAEGRVRIGLNWSGDRAVGYDLEPEDVVRSVESAIANDVSEIS